MYIIFDSKNSILQIGLSYLEDAGIHHGFFGGTHLLQKNTYFININLPLQKKYKRKFVDLRIFINSKRMHYFIIKSFNFTNNIKLFYNTKWIKSIRKNSSLFLFLFIIALSIHSIFYQEIPQKQSPSQESLKNMEAGHFQLEKTILSSVKKSLFERDYFSDDIPKIKGIEDFYILPFSKTVSEEDGFGYLVVPFKKIYLYNPKNKMSHIVSLKKCIKEKDNFIYFIYPISQKFLMALFQEADNTSPENRLPFYYFSKKIYDEEQICPILGRQDP